MKLKRVPLRGRGHTKSLVDLGQISDHAVECIRVEIARKIYAPIDTKVARYASFEIFANLKGWPVI